jgi:hypothetical protein
LLISEIQKLIDQIKSISQDYSILEKQLTTIQNAFLEKERFGLFKFILII